MAVKGVSIKRNAPALSYSPSSMSRAIGSFHPNAVELCTVGFDDDQTELPEDQPAWVRWQEGEAFAELTTRTGDKINARIGIECSLIYGQQVIVNFADGDPEKGVVVAALHDATNQAPAKVCGVETGAGEAQDRSSIVQASTMRFLRLDDGRHLAIQTQQNGDILIHSGESLHLRATNGAVHLDGACYLGAAPSSPPITGTTADGGEEIEGVPAVPHVPTPYTPPAPPLTSTPSPFQGLEEGIVRAKDIYQITPLSDPGFFAYLAGVAGAAGYPEPPPSAINARISGRGSRHTAEGDFEPEPEPDAP